MLRYPRAIWCAVAITISAVLLGPSCIDKQNQSQPEPEQPTFILRSGIVDSYRATPGSADRAWTGRLVAINLSARSYTVVGKQIHCHCGVPWSPPCIVFDVEQGIPDGNTHEIQVVGTCRGRIHDGHRRMDGVEWYILIERCSVKVR